MKERTSVSYFLYSLFVLFTIYQDSPFSLIVGAAGYSFVMPLSIIAFLFFVAFDKFKVYRVKEIKTLWLLALWLVLSSIFGIAIWKFSGNSLTVVGEYLPYKALKVLLQYISYPMYIYVMFRWLKRINSFDLVFRPVILSLMIMSVICLIEKAQIPNAFEWLHFAGGFPYYRIRLLTCESSWTAGLIFIYAGLSMFYALVSKRKKTLFFTLLCILILTATTGSKTLLLLLLLFFMSYILIISRRISRRRLLPIALLIVLFAATSGYYLLPKLMTSLSKDIESYSSFITRTYTIVIGFCLGLVFPFGMGCGAYLGIFQETLKKYIYLIRKLPVSFNTVEIVRYANQNTDAALAVKSGLIQFNLYWGILGMITLVSVFVSLYKKLKQLDLPYIDVLKSVYITAIILTIIGTFGFETLLMLSIVMYISTDYKKLNKASKNRD